MMKRESNIAELIQFYTQELFENFMPFWMEKAPDQDFGGYFTCFNNRGTQLVSTDKYIWHQGRFLWVLSRLYNQFTEINPEKRKEYLDAARLGADFLMKHSRLDNGNCVFVTDRMGNPQKEEGKNFYDTSIYADCFVVYGLAEYARASKDKKAFDFAKNLYQSVIDRFASKNWRSDPYPIPDRYKMHGPAMIMLETTQELAENTAVFENSVADPLRKKCAGYVHEIMKNHLQADHLVREFISVDNKAVDNMLGRYINPGHTMESMWFVLHYAIRNDDVELIRQASDVIYRTFELSWDNKHGGLLAFCDKDGGKPQGYIPPELKNHAMVHKIQEDWYCKLWWVHSEALYALLLCYKVTGEQKFLNKYWRAHEYVFSTFPNPDRNIGVWINIRDRQGNPVDKVVGLPVKDSFHVPRNITLILKCLKTMKQS